MGDIRACCEFCLASSFLSHLSILQSSVVPCFRRNSGKPAELPLLSSPSCSKIGGPWVGKLRNPRQWSSCFFSVFCSHTGLDSKSSSCDGGNINTTDFSYTWGPAPETLELWCCGCRDTGLFALFCYVKKSWTDVLQGSPMQQLQMVQSPQLHLLIFAPLFNSGGKCDIYIMQSGCLYLAKTYQLLCLCSLCFSHTQRVWETPLECSVWCVGIVGL